MIKLLFLMAVIFSGSAIAIGECPGDTVVHMRSYEIPHSAGNVLQYQLWNGGASPFLVLDAEITTWNIQAVQQQTVGFIITKTKLPTINGVNGSSSYGGISGNATHRTDGKYNALDGKPILGGQIVSPIVQPGDNVHVRLGILLYPGVGITTRGGNGHHYRVGFRWCELPAPAP